MANISREKILAFQCGWTSCQELSADRPEPDFQTVAEDIFIWSVGAKRSMNPLFNCAFETLVLIYSTSRIVRYEQQSKPCQYSM